MIMRLLGLVLLFGCLACVFLFEQSNSETGYLRLLHWPALILTGIGPMALVAVCCDWRNIVHTMKVLTGKSARRLQKDHEREAGILHKIGEKFYGEGARAFEGINPRGISKFVNKVLERLAARMPTPDVRQLLENERDRTQVKLVQSLSVLALGVRLTPSVGMLGTILGMVELLSTLQDPSHIGSAMSLALLTTFYGLFFSLVMWTPLQQKIERVLDVEMDGFNQTIRWLELLEKRKPANYFADDVNSSKPVDTGEFRRDQVEMKIAG